MLLAELSVDPFWMVRCAIIQVLEKISDPDKALATVNAGSSAFCTKNLLEEFNQFRTNAVGRLIVIRATKGARNPK